MGVAFALSPPYPAFTADASHDSYDVMLQRYIEERLEVALDINVDDDFTVILEQEGLGAIMAQAVSEIPLPIKFSRIYLSIDEEAVDLGGALWLGLLPVGITGGFEIALENDILMLNLVSARIGRFSFPIDKISDLTKRYLNQDLSSLSVQFPLGLDTLNSEGVSLTGLGLEQGQLEVYLTIEEEAIPAVPAEVLDSFQQRLPEIEVALNNNKLASGKLLEIKELIQQQTPGTRINPLTLKRLGEELFNSLSNQDLARVEEVLGPDLINFLEQARDIE